jgi:hypothetical protein
MFEGGQGIRFPIYVEVMIELIWSNNFEFSLSRML